MNEIFEKTLPKLKKTPKGRPFVKKIDAHHVYTDFNEIVKKSTGENAAPVLYLFFKGTDYDCGLIAADNHIISCKTTAENAVMTFIACYYVFWLGYHKEHVHFLTFLQDGLLDEEFEGNYPMGWGDLMLAFKEKLGTGQE